MMAYAIRREDGWSEISGGFKAAMLVNDELDEVSFPGNWTELATAEEREAIGIFPIEEPGLVAPGVRVTGSTIEGDEAPRRVWQTEAIPLDDLRAAALARLAARRWVEQQTTVWNGQAMPSDDVTLGRIMATVKLAELQGKASGDVVAKWKFGPGPLTAITLGQVTAYGIAIGVHLQACFDREAELAAAVLDPAADAAAILAAAEADWTAAPD